MEMRWDRTAGTTIAGRPIIPLDLLRRHRTTEGVTPTATSKWPSARQCRFFVAIFLKHKGHEEHKDGHRQDVAMIELATRSLGVV